MELVHVGRVSEGVDGQMRAARGDFVNCGWHVCDRSGIDRGMRTDLAREEEFLFVDVDGDHRRTQCVGNHDGGKPGAAAAMDGNPFAAASHGLGR
jgi:hypothetical protein